MPPTLPPPTFWVICLCAEWCGVCRDYRPVFEAVAARHPGLRFAWIDIEDEAERLGDLDIETFPTLLVAEGESQRFLGTLTPHAETLSRLLESLQIPGGRRLDGDALTVSLVAALPGAPQLWVGSHANI
jgi:thioredoxin 1